MICIECAIPEPLKKLFDAHGQEADCKYCQCFGKWSSISEYLGLLPFNPALAGVFAPLLMAEVLKQQF